MKAETWQDAVREAGNLLLNAGAILPEYIESMIQTAEELGPYIVIDKNIAMPHASPESGVKRTALSLVRLANPINFGNPDNDPVYLVFGLAAINGKSHIHLMQSLAKLIMDKQKISRLLDAPDIDAIHEILS